MVARRWKITLISITLLFAAILVFTHLSEPTYQGRSIDAWIDNYAATPLGKHSFSENRAYIEALEHIGTNALPYLVRNLARNDSVWHKKFAEWQPRLPFLLKKLIPPPKPLLNWSDGSAEFIAFGTNSLPHTIALLKHESPTVRHVATIVLVYLRERSPAATQAIPGLIELLDDPDPNVCSSATHTLGEMGPDASNAVPALKRLLAYGGTNSFLRFDFRSDAAAALGKIGPAAHAAIPELRSALQTPGSPSLAESRAPGYLRGQAAVAIWRIDGDIETALPVILEEFPGAEELPKEDWITALGEMGPRAKEAIPQLQHELNRGHYYSWIRGRITETLRKIDPVAFPQGTKN